uniref:glucan endo-1,3-beta-D-glucosidase n=1 Tax=Thraustotheca clavata TaxID=74557 RepID=A0A0A7CLH6_9STRA|nr:secreted protein [Thraustotheca clavata]
MLKALVASITLAFVASSPAPVLQSACYSPFHLDAYPLNPHQVFNYSTLYPAIFNDFKIMQPYVKAVRTYYSNYYGIDIAPIADAFQVPLYLGVFMTRADWYSYQVQSAITAGVNYTSTVKAILVGNENVAPSLNDQFSPSEVANQIYYIRDQISKQSNGKASVPIGTVQRVGDWLDSNATIRAEMLKLADACDIIGVNIYPFFSNGYDTSQPIAILDNLWNEMLKIYPSYKLRLTETGYATGGNINDGTTPPVVPTLDNSISYYNALMSWKPQDGGGEMTKHSHKNSRNTLDFIKPMVNPKKPNFLHNRIRLSIQKPHSPQLHQ